MTFFRLSVAVAALALAGCELMVDPRTDGSSSAAGGITGTSGTVTTSSTSGSSGTLSTTTGGGSTASSDTGTSTGSTGSCQPGTTGFVGSACDTALPSPKDPADWVTTDPPDSDYVCTGQSCAENGSDRSWVYPPAHFCLEEMASVQVSQTATPVPLMEDIAVTHLVWSQAPVDGGLEFDDATAASRCDPSTWFSADGGKLAVGLPSPADLIQLLDFGRSISGGLLPTGLFGAAGPYWAKDSALPARVWTVDFANGTFSVPPPESLVATHAHVRCVVGEHRTVTLAADSCDGGDCRLMALRPSGANGDPVPLNHLLYRDARGAGAMGWADALKYCNEDVGELCGQYRLASYKELVTLVNFTGVRTASSLVIGLTSMSSGSEQYWSSTVAPGNAGAVLAIDFHNAPGDMTASAGLILPKAASEAHVMCVRDAP